MDNRQEIFSERFTEALNARLSSLSSAKTRNNYATEAEHFCSWCKKDFLNVKKKDVEDYLFDLAARNRTEETLKAKYSMLRSIARCCDAELGTKLDETAFADISIGKFKERVRKEDCAVLEAVDKVLEYCSEKGANPDPKLYLMISLALECAVPTRDLIDLTCGDVHLNELGQPYLNLAAKKSGKGSGEWMRQIPLKDNTAELLNLLVAQRGAVNMNDRVFLNKWGEPFTERQIQRLFTAAMENAGIDKKDWLTVSKLNARAVVEMAAGGASPQDLMDQLDHTTPWFTRYDSMVKDLAATPVALNRITVSPFNK